MALDEVSQSRSLVDVAKMFVSLFRIQHSNDMTLNKCEASEPLLPSSTALET